MRVVYEAENIIDAHLVKGLLEQHGLPVFVRGEYLTGALGDLPTMGLVAVCVPETSHAQAHEILQAWRREQELPIDESGWDALPEPAV